MQYLQEGDSMVDYKLLDKKIKVILEDDEMIIGVFIDEYEEEKTIGLENGGRIIEIPINEIKEMIEIIE